jgi:hypothetical protein
MKYISIIVGFIILSQISASRIRPKFCVDCKFYKKDFFTLSEFGKCTLFPVPKDNDYFLVNGNKNDNNIEYHYCATAREIDRMCGEEGKFYEKK